MLAWRIQLVGDSGKLRQAVIPGVNFKRTISNAGYDLTQVVGAERCLHYDYLVKNISQELQIIFLMKLLPHYISGSPDQSSQVFRTYAPIRKLCQRYPLALDINLSLSERLEILNFNPIIVAIVRAGERSGEIAIALKQAISNIHKEIEMRRMARKGIVGGILLFIASIAIILGVSAGTSEALDSLIGVGIIEQRNFAGLILEGLGSYTRNYLWTLFLIIGFIAGMVLRYREHLKHIWPISIFDSYVKVLRSIRLVSVWLILEQAGLNIEHDEQILATAIGKKNAEHISSQRKKGETFSDLLSSRYFSETVDECCTGISVLAATNRIHLLEQLAQLLDIERSQLAATISRTFYIVGISITLGAIALILSGILLPIYASGLSEVAL